MKQNSIVALLTFLTVGYTIETVVWATPVVSEEHNNAVESGIKSRVRREEHYYDWLRDLLTGLRDGTHPSTHAEDEQYCTLYSALDGNLTQGASYTVTRDVSNLEEVGWKHVISGIECYGLWLFYKEPHYNADGTGGVGYFFKEEPEYVPLDSQLWAHWNNLVVGLRRVGARYHPLTTDSITLYEHEWYMGEQYYADADIPRLPMRINNKATSVIITGQSDWSIYKDAEFSGESECLRHEEDGSTAIKQLIFLDEQVTSVKKGC